MSHLRTALIVLWNSVGIVGYVLRQMNKHTHTKAREKLTGTQVNYLDSEKYYKPGSLVLK